MLKVNQNSLDKLVWAGGIVLFRLERIVSPASNDEAATFQFNWSSDVIRNYHHELNFQKFTKKITPEQHRVGIF